jgi:hypothetical protein
MTRTVKSNIILYSRDGTGRDSYISYNDGGFWKDKDQKIKLKLKYPKTPYTTFHSYKKLPMPLHYHSDGFGRDSYIFYNDGGLSNGFTPLSKCKLEYFLRNNRNNTTQFSPKRIFLSKQELKHQNLINKIQKNVIKRLYENEKIKFFNKNFKNLSLNEIKPLNTNYNSNNFNSNNFNKNNSAKEIFSMKNFSKKNFNLPIKLQYKLPLKNLIINSSNSAPNIKNNFEQYNKDKIKKIVFGKKLNISNQNFYQKDYYLNLFNNNKKLENKNEIIYNKINNQYGTN